jgi:hypothetical protein
MTYYKLPPIRPNEIDALLPHINKCFMCPVDMCDGAIYYKGGEFPVGYYGVSDNPEIHNCVYASDVTGDSDVLIVAFHRLARKDAFPKNSK